MTKTPKTVRSILKKYPGWTWCYTKRHIVLLGPRGERVVISHTAGDSRSMKNAEALIKKAERNA